MQGSERQSVTHLFSGEHSDLIQQALDPLLLWRPLYTYYI